MTQNEKEKTFRGWFIQNLIEEAEDIANHGADHGFSGITYTHEIIELYSRYEDDLWQILEGDAEDFGHECIPDFLASFNHAHRMKTQSGVKECIVWYACEKIAHELTENTEE